MELAVKVEAAETILPSTALEGTDHLGIDIVELREGEF